MIYNKDKFCRNSNGTPTRKYHFLDLWRKINIPKYTPKLPNKVARKKIIPSEILIDP